MSKEIILYSEDKKHKCAVELADSLDRFECPDHSVIVLFEERENGIYVIAQARDEKLETEKDQRIAELKEQLKNAIVPKFKFMEKVWHINKDYFYKKDWYIEELLVNGFEYKIDKRKNALVMWYSTYFNDYKNYKYQEKDLFATKEEAEERLKEIKNG